MSDDARQLIDNPYRASHTPIYVGDVNVTDLMARAWDRGFAAGDERLRSDYFDKRLDESWEPSPAATPDERLREALCAYRSALRSGEPETAQLRAIGDAALAAADREAPDGTTPTFCCRPDCGLRATRIAPDPDGVRWRPYCSDCSLPVSPEPKDRDPKEKP